MAKKQTFYICEICGDTIDPNDGVVVEGNIYAAGAGVTTGGLVGNYFPEPIKFNSTDVIVVDDIRSGAFHIPCLVATLEVIRKK